MTRTLQVAHPSEFFDGEEASRDQANNKRPAGSPSHDDAKKARTDDGAGGDSVAEAKTEEMDQA